MTATQILLAEQVNSDSSGPNAQAVEKVNQQAGNPSNQQYEDIRDTYLAWFNKNFELYGRKVVLQKYNGQGNGTNQALGGDQAAACADADGIASTTKAFGAITFPGWGYDSIPFTECLKRYGLLAPLGGAYYPEAWYKQQAPYAYGIIPDCETVEHLIAEYMWKRLAQPGQKAQWAGDPVYQQEARKFGIYIPNNGGYQDCAKLSNADLAEHGVHRASQYNYTLDVSQFPQQAAQAMVQFKAAGVTTVELACDPISAIFLTQQADAQRYHPEWLLHGDALTDTDGYARLYQADQANGHLFGISQLGAQNVAAMRRAKPLRRGRKPAAAGDAQRCLADVLRDADGLRPAAGGRTQPHRPGHRRRHQGIAGDGWCEPAAGRVALRRYAHGHQGHPGGLLGLEGGRVGRQGR